MAFIGERRHVFHGDLAARNVLLTDQKQAKVSDFGLSQSMYQRISVEVDGNISQPVRWMGYEVLSKLEGSIKGDVWAFGVVMWEIFMFGSLPYGGKTQKSIWKV